MGGTSDISHRLHELETNVCRLLAESNNATIKFESLGFHSLAEVKSWTINHLSPSLPFGLFPYVYTVLDCMSGTDLSETKLLHELQQNQKLKLESGVEAKAMLAFEHKIPQVFHRETSVAAKNGESYLKK